MTDLKSRVKTFDGEKNSSLSVTQVFSFIRTLPKRLRSEARAHILSLYFQIDRLAKYKDNYKEEEAEGKKKWMIGINDGKKTRDMNNTLVLIVVRVFWSYHFSNHSVRVSR